MKTNESVIISSRFVCVCMCVCVKTNQPRDRTAMLCDDKQQIQHGDRRRRRRRRMTLARRRHTAVVSTRRSNGSDRTGPARFDPAKLNRPRMGNDSGTIGTDSISSPGRTRTNHYHHHRYQPTTHKSVVTNQPHIRLYQPTTYTSHTHTHQPTAPPVILHPGVS